MVRVSDISAPSDLALEERREVIRTSRWRRRCDIANSLAIAFGKFAGALTTVAGFSHFLGLL